MGGLSLGLGLPHRRSRRNAPLPLGIAYFGTMQPTRSRVGTGAQRDAAAVNLAGLAHHDFTPPAEAKLRRVWAWFEGGHPRYEHVALDGMDETAGWINTPATFNGMSGTLYYRDAAKAYDGVMTFRFTF